MTYTIFSLEIYCSDEKVLKSIQESHLDISSYAKKGSYRYEHWEGALAIFPEWQEEAEDYLFGFNLLSEECFDDLWKLEYEVNVEIALRMDVMYKSQCNLEFSPEFVQKLSRFPKINLLISCYENPELVEQMKRKLLVNGQA